MQQKVSIATDQTSHMGAPYSPVWNFSHVIPAPICIEFVVPMNHMAPINGFIGKHSLASHVLHKNQPIVQQFHDCGYLITHISPVGDATMGPIQSSRVVVFGAGLVKIEGTAVGFAVFGAPSTPMLTCGTYPLPIGASHDSKFNGVIVGMDPEWDHQCGWNHITLILYQAFVGQVKDAASLVVAFATGGAEPAVEVAGEVGRDAVGGVLQGLAAQGFGDIIGSRDVGRRYQERMQERRRAPGADFDSANRDESVRGVAEGTGEGLAGPLGGALVKPMFDGLPSQEPEV